MSIEQVAVFTASVCYTIRSPDVTFELEVMMTLQPRHCQCILD